MEPHAPHLADALVRVPRHHFIPARAWARPASGRGRWIDRQADPTAWWEAVCSDTVVYTQLDDGRTELTEANASRTFAPTCSATSPLLVTAFLRHLAPRAGDRVLEVGTGTGWTAGLLAYLTGDPERVTTVEIDGGLAATAEANLRAAGVAPRVVTGDGQAGDTAAAPFDRTHVTCGVRDIPYAWVEQTRPGGVVVLPYQPTMRLLRLTVRDDGTAVGRLHDPCSFTPLRSQRPPRAARVPTPPRVRTLAGDTAHLLDPRPGLQILLDVVVGDVPWTTDEGTTLLSAGGSHAEVRGDQVTQSGPRDLWDEAERVCEEWLKRGSPGLDRLGVTVTPNAQYVWLDDPGVPVAQALGGG
ncbi:protein-L-isoaspartate(D-aspartate) O-methyltransferase [Streptomyces sp. B1866]|uniref:protein-L-isoaspartate O-methyltransferase family protein n=1 Tax=Streptomyces sp. B1866 TaxID=3075431 RepID=UPI00288E4E98|nr:methyltransferase domain-containing protein [Streptomyces sp. B1866]MDT3399001.1 protein-L-isoaspartate(D-aspartate) O-methyltransferase [Streptomyces sp. B1866]